MFSDLLTICLSISDHFRKKQKHREGRGRKYLEKENIFFFGGKEKLRRKRRKIVRDGRYMLLLAGNNLNLYISYM